MYECFIKYLRVGQESYLYINYILDNPYYDMYVLETLACSKAYSHNFVELMGNSTACEQFVVLMKKNLTSLVKL